MKKPSKIIDCHMQFWDNDDPSDAIRPWLRATDPHFTEAVGDYSSLQKTYLIEDYKKDIGDFPVVKTVTIDSGTIDPIREMIWLEQLSRKSGFPNAMTAQVDLLSPSLLKQMEIYSKMPMIRSVRQHVNYDTKNPKRRMADRSDLLMDSAWRKSFASIQKYGYNWDMAIFSNQLPQVVDFLRAFPDSPIILGAMGWPIDFSQTGKNLWTQGMKQIAQYPNVVVKIAAIGCIFKKWTTDQIRPWIQTTIELFGPSRCMFGSAMPVDKIHRGFFDIYNAYMEIVADFSSHEQQQMFHDTAERVYGISTKLELFK